MPITLRPWRAPDDLPPIACIWNSATWAPVSAAILAKREAEPFPAAGLRERLVATDAAGRVLAFGWVERRGFEAPGAFFLRVQVNPEWRRRGIGTALLQALEAFGQAHGGTDFEARLLDGEPGWLAFAEGHGYMAEGHHLASRLDVTTFDPVPFAGVIPRLTAEGIRFHSMAEEHSLGLEQSLYELEVAANHDEPGFEDARFPPFADWRRSTFGERPLDCIIVAAEGERAVGMHVMSFIGESSDLHVDFTGVRRGYRGRGIALAVKVIAIATARRHGASLIRTGSDSRNTPMLAINRNLGFVPEPGAGMYRCFKRL